jgi:site-specific recombinase XerD
LSKSTTNQGKTLFQFQLLAWAKDVGFTLLREFTTPNLVKFRATWGNGPNTTRRKHERLIGFFEFCISNDWLDKNPAIKMKKAEEKRVPTDYFTREEFQRIEDLRRLARRPRLSLPPGTNACPDSLDALVWACHPGRRSARKRQAKR